MVYGWATKKTETGFEWRVQAIEHLQPIRIIETGTEPTRERASRAAKRAVMPYRRGQKQG